jgi:hypothetical protein
MNYHFQAMKERLCLVESDLPVVDTQDDRSFELPDGTVVEVKTTLETSGEDVKTTL